MIEQIEIEPVQPEELEELADLAARTFRDAFGWSLTQDELDKFLAETRSVAYFEKSLLRSTILVAKHDGKVAGYVQFGGVKIPEVDAATDDMELSRIYVDTCLQRQGIGRQLLDAALSDPKMQLAPNIFLQVWEENPTAISLYENYGFVKCGVTTFDLGGIPAQDLIMVRHQPQAA